MECNYNWLYWPLLPSQQERPRSERGAPFRKLAMAMIVQALNDLTNENDPKREATALYWIFNDDRGVSFNLCCDAIDFDPDALRQHIERCVNSGHKENLIDPFQFQPEGRLRGPRLSIRGATRLVMKEQRIWRPIRPEA